MLSTCIPNCYAGLQKRIMESTGLKSLCVFECSDDTPWKTILSHFGKFDQCFWMGKGPGLVQSDLHAASLEERPRKTLSQRQRNAAARALSWPQRPRRLALHSQVAIQRVPPDLQHAFEIPAILDASFCTRAHLAGLTLRSKCTETYINWLVSLCPQIVCRSSAKPVTQTLRLQEKRATL